ncbi:ROK family protein [Humibacter ginsengiterrae]
MSEQALDARGTLVSSDVRRRNLSIVATALAERGPLSRSEIAAATGLTAGAVTLLTSSLLDAGVIAESAESEPTRRGRPKTRLSLSADHLALLVVQLDADTATALLATLAGETLARASRHHGRPLGDPDAVLDVLASVTNEALDAAAQLGRTVADVTVIAFAPVGGEPAIVLADTDLLWGPVDLVEGLRSRAPRLPEARLVGDTTAAAREELAAHPGIRDLVYLKSNSGIGGALVVDGAVIVGSHGYAGALGHVAIDHDGALCVCGQRGCLVTVAGPDLLLERARLQHVLAEQGLTAALAEFVSRLKARDLEAAAAWTDAVPWIARTVRIVTMALDPQLVVIGGFWAEPQLTETIADAFAEGDLLMGAGSVLPAVVPSGLGDDAAVLGALRDARERLLEDPLALQPLLAD